MLSALANLALSFLMAIGGGAAVRDAVQEAEDLGYHPCQPQVVDAREGWAAAGFGEMPDTVGGWAAWPEAFGHCTIGLAPWAFESAQNLEYVARHEVCHLSVGVQIDRNASYGQLEDRHHQAPDFVECMERITGQVQAPVELAPAQVFEDTDPPCVTDAECANWEYSPEDGWVSLVDNGEGDLPTCPDPYNGYCSSPDSIVHDTVTGASALHSDLYVQDPPTDAEHCAMLHEVKPWIPCE